MNNYELLRGRILSMSSYKAVAKAAGISTTTLSRRLDGQPFNSDEIESISDFLHIDYADWKKYFFNSRVHLNETKQAV